jgi:5'-deoxynucleotidase
MYHFFAYLSRMKLIDRWSLMRCTQKENVQEHSLQVAVIAHSLAVIKNKYFGGKINAEKVALYAIFHDATEVMTGDLPTPVKYFSGELRDAYKAIEGHAMAQLLKLLPNELRGEYEALLTIPKEDRVSRDLVKAADNICGYIKCLEEKAQGNLEFGRAQKAIELKIDALRSSHEEVDYFITNFVPSFSLTLDEISRPLEI